MTRKHLSLCTLLCVCAWLGACEQRVGLTHSCPTGLLFCAGQCVSPQWDADHCGACGLACGADESCEDGFCEAGCGPIEVATSDALVAVVETLPWIDLESHQGGALPVSCDVQVRGTVTLDGSQLVAPTDCGWGGECAAQIGFVVSYELDGVPGIALEDRFPGDNYIREDRLILTDVTVRFTAGIHPLHPALPTYHPAITVLEPTPAVCEEDELRCGANRTCHRHVSTYCRYCLGLGRSACPCYGEQGVLPDDTPCTYFSGDIGYSGTCQHGLCDVYGW